jgi:hypothetical protein
MISRRLVCLALCLSALLQAKRRYLFPIAILCVVRLTFNAYSYAPSRLTDHFRPYLSPPRSSELLAIFNTQVSYSQFRRCGCLEDVLTRTSAYSAEPLSSLDEELGYPCYGPSFEEWNASTIDSLGIDVRSSSSTSIWRPRLVSRLHNLSRRRSQDLCYTLTVLLVLSVTVLIMRYKGQHGHLIQVMLRDGGIYYFALTGSYKLLPLFHSLVP